MKITNNLLFLLILVILSSSVFAFESAISNYGFNEIEITSEMTKRCDSFTLPATLEEGGGILSIRADFIGEEADNTYVSVNFNDEEEMVFWPENFVCNPDCLLRVFTPKLDKDNLVEICANTGGKSTLAKVYENSSIGLYDTPVIEIEHISPEEIVLGQRAKMRIKLKNSGVLDTSVFVQFLSEDLRTFLKITSFDIVEGDASATTSLVAGEEKEFIYYIKPTQSSAYNLPSAVVSFENVFGENQKIYSNHPQLVVKDPTQINLVLVSEELTENDFEFKLVIKNNWDEEFSGNLIINPNDLIEDYLGEIILEPNEEKEITFETKNLNPGKYSILAQVNSGEVTYTSDPIDFSINKNDYTFEIIFSFIAVILALTILFWIYYSKTN